MLVLCETFNSLISHDNLVSFGQGKLAENWFISVHMPNGLMDGGEEDHLVNQFENKMWQLLLAKGSKIWL